MAFTKSMSAQSSSVVPRSLEDLAQPHIESFDYFIRPFLHDEIDEEATSFLLKNKPKLEEGSTEWQIELERKKEEFSVARGYRAF